MWPFDKKTSTASPPSTSSHSAADIARAALLWKQGSRYLERRRYDKAIACFEDARTIEPARLDGRLNLGAAYFLDGKPAEALPHLRYVLALEPQNTVALLNLAATYNALGEVDQSIECLEKLVSDRPKWADANYNLAVAYMKKERFDEAGEALHRELLINPKHEAARTLLNEVHLKPRRSATPSTYLQAQLEAEAAQNGEEKAAPAPKESNSQVPNPTSMEEDRSP